MADLTAPRPDVPDDFDGCARECRKEGKHTLVWGRCEHAAEPTPPSRDDLRGLLIAARLTSHMVTADDGHPSMVMHTNEEAAARALAVVAEWLPVREREIERRVRAQIMTEMFGPREEIAARQAEPLQVDAVGLCEMARPGEHERQARGKVAADLKRAAAGRRDYASRAPEHIAAELEAEARVFDTAARVATEPSEVMWGLLPAALWTDADRPTERREGR